MFSNRLLQAAAESICFIRDQVFKAARDMDHVSDPFLVFLFVVVLDAVLYVLAYLLVRFLRRKQND